MLTVTYFIQTGKLRISQESRMLLKRSVLEVEVTKLTVGAQPIKGSMELPLLKTEQSWSQVTAGQFKELLALGYVDVSPIS